MPSAPEAVAIRTAGLDDLDAVCALHAEAFAASDYGHNGEADLVRALHEAGDALLSLGAWADGLLVGHVLFSPMNVTADGKPISAAALAPVAVSPAWQRRGVASRLIEASHDKLRTQGVSLLFVLGEPPYYSRFGYDPALAEPFVSPYSGPYFMARALDGAPPRPLAGSAIYAAAFSDGTI